MLALQYEIYYCRMVIVLDMLWLLASIWFMTNCIERLLGLQWLICLKLSNECLVVICIGSTMVWCCNVMYANYLCALMNWNTRTCKCYVILLMYYGHVGYVGLLIDVWHAWNVAWKWLIGFDLVMWLCMCFEMV